jgi:thymidine kinase
MAEKENYRVTQIYLITGPVNSGKTTLAIDVVRSEGLVACLPDVVAKAEGRIVCRNPRPHNSFEPIPVLLLSWAHHSNTKTIWIDEYHLCQSHELDHALEVSKLIKPDLIVMSGIDRDWKSPRYEDVNSFEWVNKRIRDKTKRWAEIPNITHIEVKGKCERRGCDEVSEFSMKTSPGEALIEVGHGNFIGVCRNCYFSCDGG